MNTLNTFIRASFFSVAILLVAPPWSSMAADAAGKDSDAWRRPYVEIQIGGLGGGIHHRWTGGFDFVFAGGVAGFHSALVAPMRFDSNGLRERDWDETGDFGRIVDFVGYRNENGDISVGITPLRGYTLGPGTLVSMFNSTADVDHWHTGISARLHFGPSGCDLFMNSFLDPSVFGGRVYVRPLWFLDRDGSVGRLEIALSAVGDAFAPETLGSILPDEHGLVSTGEKAVVGWSTDVRWPVRAADWVEVVPWAAWSRIGRSDAAHVGVDLAFRPARGLKLTVSGEWRFMEGGFVEGYFDTQYMADRYDYGVWRSIYPGAVSKQAFVRTGGRDRNGGTAGFRLAYEPWVDAWFRADVDEEGWFTRFSTGLNVTVPERLLFSAVLTARGFGPANDDAVPDRLNGTLIADVTVWKYIGVFASYSRDLFVPMSGSDIGRYVSTDSALAGLRFSFGLLSERKKKSK